MHGGGKCQTQKSQIATKSATLERNKKSQIKFEIVKKPPEVLKLGENVQDLSKNVSKDVSAAKSGELKKTESGESDPGYESDSGVKKVDGVVKVKNPNLFSAKLTKMNDVSPATASSSKIDPNLVLLRPTAKVESCDEKKKTNWNKETSKSNHQIVRAGHKEKGQPISVASSLSNSSQITPEILTEVDHRDRQDSSDLVNQIIGSSVIDEMSNIKKPDSPITLEIFSPVMVSCKKKRECLSFSPSSLFFRPFIFHYISTGEKKK